MEKDYTLFGQKATNCQTDEIGLVLYTQSIWQHGLIKKVKFFSYTWII